MEHAELYDKLRLILNTMSVLPLPRHETSFNLLTNMFNEEEAEISVVGLKNVYTPVSINDISDVFEIPQGDLKKKLDEMVNKGLIRKISSDQYMALPFYPGIALNYFVYANAPLENRIKVSEAAVELSKLSWDQEMVDRKYGLFRVMPAIKPIQKTIEINEAIEVEHQILPYEILKEHVAKIDPQLFMVVPCACRESSKLAGNPCKRTEENYCISLGTDAVIFKEHGIGREVSLDELVNILEKAEKEGLVHMTTNMQETATIICNCCPCCCIYLRPFKETGGAVGAIRKSNFAPQRNTDLCELCERCSKVCPTGAIFHHYPHLEDASDEYMSIRSDLCIGCGTCASNCSNGAITMQKVRNVEPAANFMELAMNSVQGRTH